MRNSPEDRLLEEAQLEESLALSRQAVKLRETRALLRLAERRIESLENSVSMLDALSGAASQRLRIPMGRRKRSKDPHTLVAILSDWHSREIVDPAEISGLNRHNADIGLERASKYSRDLVKTINGYQGRFLIENVVLAMLGDFLVGELHGVDSARSCLDSPIEEALGIQPILVALIDLLLAETDCKFVIPCVGGNHDRTTERTRYRKADGYSYMYIIYRWLAEKYSKEPRIKFDAGPGEIKVVDVAGFNILMAHGDRGMGSRSGPAGYATPFHTAVGKWRNTYDVDIACVGHWHTRQMYRAGFINGSLVGYNAFAAHHNLPFERPSQWVFLVDHERRDVGTASPIWVD